MSTGRRRFLRWTLGGAAGAVLTARSELEHRTAPERSGDLWLDAIAGKKHTTRLDVNSIVPDAGRTNSDLATYIANDGVLNVKDFGAKGDGLTDDTAAIQAAINANPPKSNPELPVLGPHDGGWVVLPSGIFRITAPLILGSGQGIVGSGPTSVIFNDSPTTPAIKIGDDTRYILGVTVRDLRIQAKGVSDAGAHGISAYRLHKSNIGPIWVTGCGGDGIRLNGSSYTYIRDSYIYANYGRGIHLLTGPAPENYITATFVTGNTVRVSGQTGIAGYALAGCFIEGNTIEANGFQGEALGYLLAAVTADPATDVLSMVAIHGRATNDVVRIATSGTLPSPLVAGTNYYAIVAAGPGPNFTMQLAAAPNGAPIDITTAGTGVNRLYTQYEVTRAINILLAGCTVTTVRDNYLEQSSGPTFVNGTQIMLSGGYLNTVSDNLFANYLGMLLWSDHGSTPVYNSIEGNTFSEGGVTSPANLVTAYATGQTYPNNNFFRNNHGIQWLDADGLASTNSVAGNGQYAGLGAGIQALTQSGATLTPDYGVTWGGAGLDNGIRKGLIIKITLTGALSINLPTNRPDNGQVITFLFLQDNIGGHAVTWDGQFAKLWTDAGNVAKSRSSIQFVWVNPTFIQVGAQMPWT